MSDSVQPHRRQHTKLLRPWDSPGKNTGVGCHFLLQYMKVKSEIEVAQSYLTLSDPMDCSPPGSSVHGIFRARGLEWVAIAFSSVVGNAVFSYWTSALKICPIPSSSFFSFLHVRLVAWIWQGFREFVVGGVLSVYMEKSLANNPLRNFYVDR